MPQEFDTPLSQPNSEEKEERPLEPMTTAFPLADPAGIDGRTNPTAPSAADLICGVDRIVVERFLVLVRDNYKKADEATFFLEQRSGVMNVPSMANMRDVLSHLVTLLNHDTPNERREEQLATSEEHLRRAILEPYEIALNELTIKFEELYEKYKTRLLPVQDKHVALKGAPNTISIEATLSQINKLSSEGRAGKARNLWNPEWEKAVAAYISAFDQLDALYVTMETHWNNYEQIRRDKRSTIFHLSAITIGIVGIILAVFFALVPSAGDPLRKYLKREPAASTRQAP